MLAFVNYACMGAVFAVCPSQQRQIKGAPDDLLDLKLRLAIRTRLVGTLMASCLRLSRLDPTVMTFSSSLAVAPFKMESTSMKFGCACVSIFIYQRKGPTWTVLSPVHTPCLGQRTGGPGQLMLKLQLFQLMWTTVSVSGGY